MERLADELKRTRGLLDVERHTVAELKSKIDKYVEAVCYITVQKADYMGRVRVGKHLNGNALASNRDRPFSLKHCPVRCIFVDSMTIVLDIEYTLSLRLCSPNLHCQPVDFLFVFFLPLYRARRFTVCACMAHRTMTTRADCCLTAQLGAGW